jgi:hypothetical protein
MHSCLIVFIFIVGMAIAGWNGSMFEAQVTLFGCLLLYCLRRVEELFADDIAVRSRSNKVARRYTLTNVRKLSPGQKLSDIYKGDSAVNNYPIGF